MKLSIRFGIWTGIAGSLWALATFPVVGWLNTAAFHGSLPAADIRSIGGLLNIVILLVGVWMGMQTLRRRNGGRLAYRQALFTGIKISCVTAAIVALFSWLYCTVINPGLADDMVIDAERTLRHAGKTPDEVTAALQSVRRQFGTGAQVAMALVGQAVVGSLASFLLALFASHSPTKRP